MADIKYNYETVMIFNTQSGDEGLVALKERFRNLVLANGVIDSEEEWGKRRLAYPIMDELEGYYYMIRFTSDGNFPAELDRVYNITEGVLRSMIIRIEKPVPKPEPEAVAEEPEPEAVAEESESEAVAEESEPEAVAEESEPEAVAEESEPEAVAEESEPEAVAEESEPEAVAEESEPEAVAEESEPEADAEA